MTSNSELFTASETGPPGPDAPLADDSVGVAVRSVGLAALAWRQFRRHKLALGGAVVLVVLIAAAIFAPWITPYDPNYGDFSAFNGAPSPAHPLGTDFAGRDMLSRLLYGGRVSLLIGFSAMLTSIVFGTLVGSIAGYCGGWVDNVIMRVIDAILSFPLYLLLFVLSSFIAGAQGGRGIVVIVLIIVVVSWTYTARIVRGEFLALKERDFIQAARATGVSAGGIIRRHLLPNAIAPIVVNATLLVGNSIILESVLSFFSFGVQPPTSSWGSMLADGLPYQSNAPWETVYPGLMILITVLSVNLLGDGLRDALDPFRARR